MQTQRHSMLCGKSAQSADIDDNVVAYAFKRTKYRMAFVRPAEVVV